MALTTNTHLLLPIVCGLFVLITLSVVIQVAAFRSAWVCDDAFISFRYVDNLEHGLGLVYNAGERVEGELDWTLRRAFGRCDDRSRCRGTGRLELSDNVC